MCLQAFSMPVHSRLFFLNCYIVLHFIDGPYLIEPLLIAQHFGCYYFFTMNICCKAKPRIFTNIYACISQWQRSGNFCTDTIYFANFLQKVAIISILNLYCMRVHTSFSSCQHLLLLKFKIFANWMKENLILYYSILHFFICVLVIFSPL